MEERRLNCEWGKAVRGGFVGPDTSSKAVFGGVNGKEVHDQPPLLCAPASLPGGSEQFNRIQLGWLVMGYTCCV